MTTAIRRFTFNAGHRLWKHEGRCQHIHGHNYVVFFHATAEKLDNVGRVIDFNVLKSKLGGWIDTNWDHGFICHKGDAMVQEALKAIDGQKIFLLEGNPTAENLAGYLLHVVGPELLSGTGVRLSKIVLWETENCCVEVSL